MSYRDMERTARVPQSNVTARPDALSSSAAKPPAVAPAPTETPVQPAPTETPKD